MSGAQPGGTDEAIAVFPDDWDAHLDRGLALAGLGRRDEALREARWLEQSVTYREDTLFGSYLAAGRAQILAQVGDAEGALDALGQLLAKPSPDLSVQQVRLNPVWDPIREQTGTSAAAQSKLESERRHAGRSMAHSSSREPRCPAKPRRRV